MTVKEYMKLKRRKQREIEDLIWDGDDMSKMQGKECTIKGHSGYTKGGVGRYSLYESSFSWTDEIFRIVHLPIILGGEMIKHTKEREDEQL